MDSILISVKKSLGIEQEYTHFDPDIILHTNSALLTLNQIGIGPQIGFMISGEQETWIDLLGERQDLEAVKTFLYLKVRLIFDPPQNSFLVKAMEDQTKEIEWRLNIQAEGGVVNEND